MAKKDKLPAKGDHVPLATEPSDRVLAPKHRAEAPRSADGRHANSLSSFRNGRRTSQLHPRSDTLQREIAERERVEQALSDSEERYRRVVEDQTEFIVRWLPNGIRTFVNDSYCRYFRQPREALIGKSFFPLITKEYREAVREKIAALVPEHPVATSEHQVILPDGGVGWNEWTDRAIFNKHGKLIEFQSVGRDITERKRLQEQILQARRMESIGRLAGGIAHDFGNILWVISGNASMLQRQPEVSRKSRDIAEEIAKAADRASTLTRQLLMYARGSLQNIAPVDLNGVIRSVSRMFVKGGLGSIDFDLSLAKNLPRVVADSVQIEQVMMNLCLNARQASRPPYRVVIQTREQTLNPAEAAAMGLSKGRYVQVTVADRGSGMDADTVQRMFDPFFTTKPKGRGMGLALAESIIRNHHGQIRADSRPGRGTTITLLIKAIG